MSFAPYIRPAFQIGALSLGLIARRAAARAALLACVGGAMVCVYCLYAP